MSGAQLLADRALNVTGQGRREALAGLHHAEEHDRLVRVLRPPLAHADRVAQLGKAVLEHAVDLGAAEAHARRVQDAVGAPQEDQLPRRRVDHDEVAMRPHVVVLLKVGREVAGARRVVPEAHRHVGERGCGDEFAGRAVADRDAFDAAAAFDKGVVDGDGRAEGWALCAAYIDGRQGVLHPEAARYVGSAGDVG